MKRKLFFLFLLSIFLFCGDDKPTDVGISGDEIVKTGGLAITNQGVVVKILYSECLYGGWSDPARINYGVSTDTFRLNAGNIDSDGYLIDEFLAINGLNIFAFLPSLSNNIWADTNIIRESPFYYQGILGFIRKGGEIWSIDRKTLIYSTAIGDTLVVNEYGVPIDKVVSRYFPDNSKTVVIFLKGFAANQYLTISANVEPKTFVSLTDKNGWAKFVFIISEIEGVSRGRVLIFNFPREKESILFDGKVCKLGL